MRRFLFVAAVVAAAVLVVPVAFAGKGPANKATGDLWFLNYGGTVPAHWVFDAHDVGAAADDKGSVFYEDVFGFYHADVTSVEVHSGTHAVFTAVVTHSSYPGITAGMSFSWGVYDLGEPGVAAGDYFTYAGIPFYITAGNIQIHFYD